MVGLDAGARATGPGGDLVVNPDSCEVEVTVRYNAVCRTSAGLTQNSSPPQDQKPKSGKKDWIKAWSSQLCSIIAT